MRHLCTILINSPQSRGFFDFRRILRENSIDIDPLIDDVRLSSVIGKPHELIKTTIFVDLPVNMLRNAVTGESLTQIIDSLKEYGFVIQTISHLFIFEGDETELLDLKKETTVLFTTDKISGYNIENPTPLLQSGTIESVRESPFMIEIRTQDTLVTFEENDIGGVWKSRRDFIDSIEDL